MVTRVRVRVRVRVMKFLRVVRRWTLASAPDNGSDGMGRDLTSSWG